MNDTTDYCLADNIDTNDWAALCEAAEVAHAVNAAEEAHEARLAALSYGTWCAPPPRVRPQVWVRPQVQVRPRSLRLLIALGHKSRVGKDTIGDYLVETFGATRFAFSAPLYVIMRHAQEARADVASGEITLSAGGCRLASAVMDICGCPGTSDGAQLALIGTCVNIVKNTVGPVDTKEPALLQLIGESMKTTYGELVWVDAMRSSLLAEMAANPDGSIVVTDMRFPAEMQALVALGFVTVRVHKADRVIDRDPTHPSEVALDGAAFDYEVNNDATIAHLRAKMAAVIGRILRSRHQSAC